VCLRTRHRMVVRDKVLELGSRTLIMGVLNVTPDSFSDGAQFLDPAKAIARAWEIAEEGADILDIGGESTRPGSTGVTAEEELRRVFPVLEALAGSYPLPMSLDTSKAEVARAGLREGVALVNDVTALRNSPEIAEEVAASGAGLILMHMRGEPSSMQRLPASPDILAELESWAERAVATAQASGVSFEKIILDPGIGFGKTARQNLGILRNLERLAQTGLPLLVGTSRKSFIGEIVNRPAGQRVWGTAGTVAASIFYGAHIVRVHDVAAMRDVARVIDALVAEGTKP
jgi:dihydropteroate synthase